MLEKITFYWGNASFFTHGNNRLQKYGKGYADIFPLEMWITKNKKKKKWKGRRNFIPVGIAEGKQIGKGNAETFSVWECGFEKNGKGNAELFSLLELKK